MKMIFRLFLIPLILVIGIGSYFVWEFLIKPAHSPNVKQIVVEVEPGDHLNAVVSKLSRQNIHIPELPFKVWNRLTTAHKRLHVGEFEIPVSNSSAFDIINAVLDAQPKGHRITIREGLNIWDIAKIFNEAPLNVPEETFLGWMRSPEKMRAAGVPVENLDSKLASLEGYLFPDTYTFFKYTSPEVLVDQMIELFKKNTAPILSQHQWGNSPEGRHRLLTLASIVEKESGDLDEQPVIASVYWNRIRKNMRLQADPTTIYGLMPNFNGNLTRKNLRERTPYNTYKMKGLPAGPIANIGVSTAKATVSPATTDYLFFVSKNDGTHIFSKDYKTHDKWVTEYQRKRRSKKSSAID